MCVPGSAASCYSGPANTEGIGICKAGTKLCNPQGTGYGACVGQILPKPVDLCSTPADDDCSGSPMPCVNDTLWTRTATNSYFGAVAVDSSGRTALASQVSGTTNWGSGPISSINGASALVVMFDAAGNPVWNKVWGGNQTAAFAVAFDASDNLIVGGLLFDVANFGGGPLGVQGERRCFLVKLTPAGTHLWSRASRCLDAGLQSIAVDAAGNVIVAGFSQFPVNFGAGPLPHTQTGWDVFVVKFDPSGNQIWGKNFGKEGGQGSRANVATDAAGNVLVASDGQGFDFGGGPVSGYYAVFKLHPDGSFAWSKGIMVQDPERPPVIAVDPAGSPVVSGYFHGSMNVGLGQHMAAFGGYVARFDSSGNPLWEKVSSGGWSSHVDVAPDGTIYLGGGFAGSIDFGAGPYMTTGMADTDAFLARLDPAGNPIAAKIVAGAAGNPTIASFARTPTGNVVATGQYTGTIDFGNGAGPITSINNNSQDMFLAKFVP